MKDPIERQAIINELESWLKVEGYSEGELNIIKAVLYELQSLPSAQPERKPGHWETYIISMLDGDGCRCSECGFEGVPYWDFCPTCGADMRGEHDDSI